MKEKKMEPEGNPYVLELAVSDGVSIVCDTVTITMTPRDLTAVRRSHWEILE